MLALGAVGEFGPLLAISLFLSGRSPIVAAVVLIVFALVAGGGIWLATRGSHGRLHRLVTITLRTSGQFGVRLVILIVAALVALGIVLGLDMLLGAFAAGVLWRVLVSNAPEVDRDMVESKLEGVAFGFLVPVFFIYTGVTFDLTSLLSSAATLALVPLFLVLLLLVRGLPGLLAAPAGSSGRDKIALVLLTATGLPIIVAVTEIGTESGMLTHGVASALVGAGMLSVLLFPLIGLSLRRRAERESTASTVGDATHDG